MWILFLIGGIIIYKKAELKISSKRKITGKKAKNMGVLFIVASLLSISSTYAKLPMVEMFAFVLYGIGILLAIYFVFFTKGDIIENIENKSL